MEVVLPPVFVVLLIVLVLMLMLMLLMLALIGLANGKTRAPTFVISTSDFPRHDGGDGCLSTLIFVGALFVVLLILAI